MAGKVGSGDNRGDVGVESVNNVIAILKEQITLGQADTDAIRHETDLLKELAIDNGLIEYLVSGRVHDQRKIDRSRKTLRRRSSTHERMGAFIDEGGLGDIAQQLEGIRSDCALIRTQIEVLVNESSLERLEQRMKAANDQFAMQLGCERRRIQLATRSCSLVLARIETASNQIQSRHRSS
uniref:Uncharacterized protein n=1 Tax=Spongospora subterranea TaxID=70186 RepID=A0A0H5QLE3_9EUKA|eukprot:CRZ02810.1 hypothetical protein [Spongospora subterranea]